MIDEARHWDEYREEQEARIRELEAEVARLRQTPHCCPVCGGTGQVHDGVFHGTADGLKRCPACNGKCVLWR